jgi:cobalt ECF transporter T component CbiQ
MTAESVTAPDWLLQGEVGLCPCGCIGRRTKGSFVDKTINGAARVMRQAVFAEDTAAADGLLQRVEPRVKLVSLLLLLVAAGLVRHVPVLVAMYLAALALAAASRIPVGFFVKRVWLFIPIFTGIVALPATLSIITPGRIVLSLGHWWFGHEIGFAHQGLVAAGLIVLRVAVSISLVVLLTLTTPWNRVLAALRALLVPRIFVLVLGMCYRYVFTLLNAVTDMYTARKARNPGREAHDARGRSFVAASAGALFGKANALSEEVHLAMVSRGYTGSAVAVAQRRIRPADLVWGLTCAAAAVVFLGVDRVLGR